MSASSNRWPCREVKWHAPGNKRLVAYSSASTKDWIDMLTDCGLTVEQMHRASVLDTEAQMVLEAYMELGYSEWTGIKLGFQGASIDGKTEHAVRKMLGL